MSNNFIICKKCKNKIHANYKKCPICGSKLSNNTVLIVLGLFMLIFLVYFFLMFLCIIVFPSVLNTSGDTMQISSGDVKVEEVNQTEEISEDPNYGINKSRVNSAFKIYNEVLDYIDKEDYNNAIKKYNYLIKYYSDVTLELTHEELLIEIENLIPRLTAEELAKAYEENEIKADSLYKDKIIIVTGYVDSIGVDILDIPYITLSDGEKYSFSNPQCYFSDENEIAKLSELKEGDKVTVKGKCQNSIFGSANLENCFIIEN